MRGEELLLFGGGLPQRTRDEIRDVQFAFQGLRVTLPNGLVVPNPHPFVYSLDSAGRRAARAAERAAVVNGRRTTHCLRQLSYGYSEPDFTYPLPPADFTQRLGEFRALLLEDLAAGLIPIVEMAGDGQGYDPHGGTYGWPWFMDNYPRVAAGIGHDVLDQCVEFDCWEAVNYGGWSPDNLFAASRLVRSVRPNAVLAWHFSYAWPGDRSGALGGPIVEWATDGADCDVMLAEGDAPFLSLVDGAWRPFSADDPDARHRDAVNGWQQRARCFLGPRCNDALIYPGNREPYYWPAKPDTPRGDRTAVAMELDEYRDDRGAVILEEVRAEQAYCGALGFTNVC